ncbi:hypothetical protein H696_00563 [Fonticula alba]|uniref:RRM domain-containing protein n=1 Tax=Fonticula alba TaxID=691883 RepID=A0A058ZGG3_FONAL|nr:hypothetical protein H696_00563 [Fonticula alba]KCV73013.1 hypothetical protein H696_00563 [Fonticula alba]|eukprot:XP_009492714.1 hypothetical protein H696_00563 [Fonticula alba]
MVSGSEKRKRRQLARAQAAKATTEKYAHLARGSNSVAARKALHAEAQAQAAAQSADSAPAPADAPLGEAAPGLRRTVYVSGLAYESTEAAIRKFFAGCGPIEHLNLPKFRDSGRCMGYCHITFAKDGQGPDSDDEDAEAAAHPAVVAALALNGQVLDGRYLDIDRARGHATDRHMVRGPAPPGAGTEDGPRNIYVGNLPYSAVSTSAENDASNTSATLASLRKLFERYGAVTDVRPGLCSMTGRFKGFAYIQFESGLSTKKAVEDAHGRRLGGRPLRVDYDASAGPRAGYDASLRWIDGRRNTSSS